MRIYIGNKEIAGYFTQLKTGFDKIGVKSDLWFLVGSDYYQPPMNRLARLNQSIFRYYRRNRKLSRLPLLLPAAGAMVFIQTIIFLYALISYDVFILNSQPFFSFHELAVLRFFRKKIIVVFLGTESRPAYLSGNIISDKYTSGTSFKMEKCFRDTKAQYERIRRIEKYANYIINHPPTALFQAKPFISWLQIGFPHDKAAMSARQRNNEFSRVIKILHAPSHREAKGTRKIEEIISQLQSEGLPIEYIRLEGVPNERVIDELSRCDLVVDELYSDIPIGGLGTEAAFAKRAVINAGYYARHIHADYPENLIPPACFCLPDELSAQIKNLVINKDERNANANKLNRFVTLNWTNDQVASRFMKLIDGTFPADWYIKPQTLTYFQGYGISNEKLKLFIRHYVLQNNLEALYLNDKPGVLQKVKEFITEVRKDKE